MAEAMDSTCSFDAFQPSMSVSYSCNANMSSSDGIGVKIGGLWKRSQGIRRFTKHNYRHRVFILTDQALSYYGGTIDRVGQCKGRVQLDKIRAVEFVDIEAFNLAHSLQILYHTKKSGFTTLYVIATTKEECADWVNTLRQACYFNQDMLMHYHPGALVRSKWTCCSQRGQTTLGCQPTYHLLTRSSSRYAQLRRRDTLTSSQRWTRAGSQMLFEGRLKKKGTSGTVTSQRDDSGAAEIDGKSSPGQGRSTSCVDLCALSPVLKEPFSPARRSAATTNSQRSSCNSNDHSVGMGSMLLTRVSVATMTGNETEVSVEEERQSQRSNNIGDGSSIRSPVVTRGKLARRSQVAPAWTSSTSSTSSVPLGPAPNRHSYEYEHRTLPRSFKTTTSVARTRGTGAKSSPSRSPKLLRRSLKENPSDDIPVAPPRVKRGTGTPVSQAPPMIASSPITEHVQRSLLSSGVPQAATRSQLKHSKTFTAHGKRLPSGSGGFSQSMGALTKPLIEPKVSLSNPNIIHV